ncbi:PREDICTED: zinc finger protein 414-like [Cyprinodon variegatus]|uniref:Zinc finger protein 414-like n=1 Tax=Cyprinodon variegatus TaxID=28743 RepID=A0A3Q2E7K5_CYPVA|nr:PREDICTED: zinc finger protein 414-like [Cyprinodon variegatus]
MAAVMESPGSGASGSRRLPCPLHGCKRVYSETNALESHVKDHESPVQSLPGKKLLCSFSGCSASFPSMQKLLEHGRHHYKANIYFQCESCRTKLRSYRGLLAHLHTCSKMPRAKAPPTVATNPAPRTTYLPPPQLEWESSPQSAAPLAQPEGSVPASSPPQESADPPALGPPILTLQEPPPLSEASPVTDDDSTLPVGAKPAAAEPPDVQNQGRATGSPAYAPSAAVWRKNQAMSSHRRVLWEHTRGRYTCTQCGHTLTNRKDMTQHISSQHGGGKSAPDAGGALPKS